MQIHQELKTAKIAHIKLEQEAINANINIEQNDEKLFTQENVLKQMHLKKLTLQDKCLDLKKELDTYKLESAKMNKEMNLLKASRNNQTQEKSLLMHQLQNL